MSQKPSKLMTTDLVKALEMVDELRRQAAATNDPHIKRMLLESGCEVIDHVITHHRLPADKAA